jgi:hypothetical protein
MKAQYIKINSFGSKCYYKDKQMTILHRTDGPAFEGRWGDKEWRIDGALHREDGPAIEWWDGNKSWYLNGDRISEEEFIRQTAPEIILTMDEIAAKFGVEVSKLKIKK